MAEPLVTVRAVVAEPPSPDKTGLSPVRVRLKAPLILIGVVKETPLTVMSEAILLVT